MPRRLTASIFVAVGLFSCLLAGCGRSLPATVKGTVTLDGQPLPEGPRITGSIIFYPDDGGAAGYGTVTSGGKYNIQTGDNNGLQPGEYLVTVRVIDIDPPPPGGYNNPPNSKSIIPLRYRDRQKSDLRLEVIPGKNKIDLELSS